MGTTYQFLLKPEGTPGPLCQRFFDGRECVEVRDLTMRVKIQVLAENISPYRHAMILEGTPYQILNVVRH